MEKLPPPGSEQVQRHQIWVQNTLLCSLTPAPVSAGLSARSILLRTSDPQEAAESMDAADGELKLLHQPPQPKTAQSRSLLALPGHPLEPSTSAWTCSW